MNKKTALFLVIYLIMTYPTFAQKFGYVDSDFVIKKMPSYEKAQQNLDNAAKKWNEDIQKIIQKADKLKSDFLSEELLLTDELKKEKQEEIKKIEEEARQLQNRTFGNDGQYDTRRKELLKPVMEEMYKAIEKMARKNKLQIVLSNSEGMTVLYAEPRHDYTEETLEELGLKEDGSKNEKTEKNEKKSIPKDNNPTKKETIDPKNNQIKKVTEEELKKNE